MGRNSRNKKRGLKMRVKPKRSTLSPGGSTERKCEKKKRKKRKYLLSTLRILGRK